MVAFDFERTERCDKIRYQFSRCEIKEIGARGQDFPLVAVSLTPSYFHRKQKKIRMKKTAYLSNSPPANCTYFCGLAIFCVLRELIFAIRTDWFFLRRIIFLQFSESTQYPALMIFSFLLSTCNRNTYFQTILQCGYPL